MAQEKIVAKPQEISSNRTIFITSIIVTISDINYGGHLGHANMVTLIHEARIRFLKEYGYSESDIQGAGLIVSELDVRYLKQVYHGETLTFKISISDISKARATLIYTIENEKNEVVGMATTKIAFIDYASGKVLRTPDFFTETYNANMP